MSEYDHAVFSQAVLKFPLRCTHCHSSKVRFTIDDLDLGALTQAMQGREVEAERLEQPKRKPRWITCLDCGQRSSLKEASKSRQQKIVQYVRSHGTRT